MQKLLQKQKGVSFTHLDMGTSSGTASPNKVKQGRAFSWAGDNLVVAYPSSWNADDGEACSRGSSSAAGSPVVTSPLGPNGGYGGYGQRPPDVLHHQQAAAAHLELLRQPEVRHASEPLPKLPQGPASPAGDFDTDRPQRPWEEALPQRRPSSFFTLRDYPSRVQPLPHSPVVGSRLASARSLRLIQLGALAPNGEAASQALYLDSPDFGARRQSEGSGPPSSHWPRSARASESGAVGGSCGGSAGRGHCILNSAPAAETAAGRTRRIPRRNFTESQLVIPGLLHEDERLHHTGLSLPGGMLGTTLEEELGMLSGYGNT